MDFTKIENIIFVSVLGALCALFLASVIAVAAKGKRKCRAVDVVLRFFAVLVFIAAAVLFTCSIMIDLSGSFRIDLSDAQAVMVVSGWSYELPLVPMFAALATVVGRYLALGLAVLALLAFIVDCALANKKDKKADKKAAAKKSPEQIKREQDIARIRKLANAAVEKSNTAVAAEARAEETAKADDGATEENEKVDEAAEDNFDWRVDNNDVPKHTEFVGIHENDADDNFDTFDDTPEDEDAQVKSEQNEEDFVEEDLVEEEIVEESFEENIDEPVEEPIEDGEEEQAEEFVDEETDEHIDEEDEEPTDEVPFYEEGSYVPEDDQEEENAPASDNTDVDNDSVAETAFTEPTDDNTRGGYDYSDVDRDFYIPGIRTYVRSAPEPKKAAKAPEEKPAPKKKPATQTKKSTSTTRKPAAKKSTATAKKPAEKPTNTNTGAAQKQNKTAAGDRLPVNRRYVIIDRSSAVNAFSDYLKERDKTEKDKLTSSINKIIIK